MSNLAWLYSVALPVGFILIIARVIFRAYRRRHPKTFAEKMRASMREMAKNPDFPPDADRSDWPREKASVGYAKRRGWRGS